MKDLVALSLSLFLLTRVEGKAENQSAAPLVSLPPAPTSTSSHDVSPIADPPEPLRGSIAYSENHICSPLESDFSGGVVLAGEFHSPAEDGQVTIDLAGRIHADLWTFPGDSPGVNAFESGDPLVSPQNRIGLRRLRLGATGDLPMSMIYEIEVEFASGNEVEFRDAYFGWEETPLFQTLLIGNQKRPYGLDHLNSSNFNVFMERPFIVEAFNQDARRFGICSYGSSVDENWNWRLGVFNQRLIQDEGEYISDELQAQIAGRIATTFWYDENAESLNFGHLALSGTWADTDPNADDDNFAGSGANEADFRTRPEARSFSRWLDTDDIDGATDYGLLGIEGLINMGPLQVAGEYQNVWLQRELAESLHFHGGYLYVSYFLTGEHMQWDRTLGILDPVDPINSFIVAGRPHGVTGYGPGAWQVAFRWSYGDLSDGDVQGGIGESVTAGLNWYWTTNARLQLNYIYGEISDNELNTVTGAPNFGSYQIIGTRVMVFY